MELDQQQKAAVETSSRKAMVLAGAGAGKTRVLVERIAHLIENGASPYEVMAFTFTRKAAGEIRDRLVERIGNRAYKVEMGTMHALALRMVKRFGSEIGFRWQGVTVYGDFEEQFLLKEIAKEMFIYDGKKRKVPKKEVDKAFNYYYQTGIEPLPDHPARQLFDVFIARCKENQSMTYGGLLVGLRLLIPKLAQYLKTKYILVDEIQDIDELQWSIINEMVEAFGASLFVSGDVDQSIYQWRGAVPEYLVKHQNEFDIYRIEANYRSVKDIVAAANSLITRNTDRIEKTMFSVREAKPLAPESVQTWKDANSEKIIELAQAWHCEEAPVVVLSRIHGLLQKIDSLMTEAEIPHTYIGKQTALTNSEPFRRFHAFLKLLVNPHDNFSFLLIKDLIGLSKEAYSEIRSEAVFNAWSHFQQWSFVNKTYDFFEVAPGYNFPDVIGRLLGSLTWPTEMKPITDFISDYIANGPNPQWNEDCCIEGPIQAYLDWLATFDLQDELKADNEGIILATIHAAKGLEWDTVIVAGMNEGILPSKQALNNGELEAERRLAYVAMTRAKDQLILAVRPEFEEKDGRTYESPISRFIAESQP
jgi:DNA helicase-2/ATP-dependent DNA helicase PcrA